MTKRKKTSEFRLTVSHFKILATIKELNDSHKYPTARGVNNILMGKLDVETRQYIKTHTKRKLHIVKVRLWRYKKNQSSTGYFFM